MSSLLDGVGSGFPLDVNADEVGKLCFLNRIEPRNDGLLLPLLVAFAAASAKLAGVDVLVDVDVVRTAEPAAAAAAADAEVKSNCE